jgi:cytochrome c oxidase subunit 3
MGGVTENISKAKLWGGDGSPFRISYGKQWMWMFLVSDALTFGALLTAYGFARHSADSWPIGEETFNAMPFLGNGYPLLYVALMTFILIVSSVTMVLAVEAGHRKDKKGVSKWLLLTVVGGLFFVGSQAWEWYHFIHGTHYGSILTTEGWAVVDYVGNDLVLQFGRGVEVVGAEAQNLWNGAIALAGNGATEPISLQGANLIENEYAPNVPQYANFFFFITGFHGFHVFSGVVFNLIIYINVVRGVYDERGHFEMVEKVGLYWHFVDLVWVFVFTFFYLV